MSIRITNNKKFKSVVLILFSVVIALGSCNPFSLNNSFENGLGVASPVIQVIEAICIVFFLYYTRSSQRNNKKLTLPIVIFFFVYICVDLFYNVVNAYDINYVLYLKLLLCILLCISLPRFLWTFGQEGVYVSLISYSLVCVIIAVLFTFGFLDRYTLWSSGRAFILGDNPNSMSSRMVVAFLSIFHLLARNPLRWNGWRHLLWFVLLPLVNSIIATGSRGSFITLIVCLMVYILLGGKGIEKKGGILILIVAFSLFGWYFISKYSYEISLFDRLSAARNEQDDGGRAKLVSDALNIFMHNPLGISDAGFMTEMRQSYGENRTVHNLYIYVLLTSGPVGFLFFSIFVAILLKKSWEIKYDNSLPLVFVLFVLLLALKTGGMLTFLIMWYCFALCMTFQDC